MDELILLNRIRVDIGNVSGSLIELLQYAGMAGFNDNYEPQTKPRLVGTWTITDYYTPAQLAQAQATFDGLTIVGDPNYVLDFSQMAVQVLDPNEDNYNPAVAIILQGQGLGTTTTSAPLGHGRWFLTKAQAAQVTQSQIKSCFSGKTTVADSSAIVTSDSSLSYDFEYFNEFKYFTVFPNPGSWSESGNFGFQSCTKLKEIEIPSNITNITTNGWGNGGFNGCASLYKVVLPESLVSIGSGVFQGCSALKKINIPQSITTISSSAFKNAGSSSIEETDKVDINLPNLTTLEVGAFHQCKFIKSVSNLGSITAFPTDGYSTGMFANCTNLISVILPENFTILESNSFNGCTNLESLNLPQTLLKIGNGCFSGCYKYKLPSLPKTITSVGWYAFGNIASSLILSQDDLIDINLPLLSSTDRPFAQTKMFKSASNIGQITQMGHDGYGIGFFTNCTNLEFVVVPASVTIISNRTFVGIKANAIIRFEGTTPPTISSLYSGPLIPNNAKGYVGDGSSAAHDDAILADYLADTNWATYSSRLDTWYNYLHPQA